MDEFDCEQMEEDQEDEDEQDLAELEALLYSRIHYAVPDASSRLVVTSYTGGQTDRANGELEEWGKASNLPGSQQPSNGGEPSNNGCEPSNGREADKQLDERTTSDDSPLDSSVEELVDKEQPLDRRKDAESTVVVIDSQDSGESSSEEEEGQSKYVDEKGSGRRHPAATAAGEDESESSSDDDDGIIVLSTPERTFEVIDLSDGSSLSSEPESSEASSLSADEAEKPPARGKLKTVSNPFFAESPPASKVVVSRETSDSINKNDVKNIKRLLPAKEARYSEAYDSDSDSSVLSLDETHPSVLNVLGMGQQINDSPRVADVTGEVADEEANNRATVVHKWTESMNRFYNEVDRGMADVSIEAMLARLPRDPHLWKVDRCDAYDSVRPRARYFTQGRCNNCSQFGHLARHCPDPHKAVRCHMCGQEGHREPRCPSKCCLRCGEPGVMYLSSCVSCRRLNNMECLVCGVRGHLKRDCPDRWRRFHRTISPGGVVRPSADAHKPAAQRWCCNCGRRGHLLHQCSWFIASKYIPADLRVKKYSQPAGLCDEQQSPREKRFREMTKEEKKVARKEMRQRQRLCRSEPGTPVGGGGRGGNAAGGKPYSQPVTPGGGVRADTNSLLSKAVDKLNKGRQKPASKREAAGGGGGDLLLFDDGSKFEGNNNRKRKQLKEIQQQQNWKKGRLGRHNEEPAAFPRGDIKSSGGGGGGDRTAVPSTVRAVVKLINKERNVPRQGEVRRVRRQLERQLVQLKRLQPGQMINRAEKRKIGGMLAELRNYPKA